MLPQWFFVCVGNCFTWGPCQCSFDGEFDLDPNSSGLYQGVLSIPQSFRSLCKGISYAANMCKHEQRLQQICVLYTILSVTYCTYRYRYCGTINSAGILIFCGSQTFYDHRSLLARPFVSFKLLILGVFVGDDCYIGVFMDVICDLFLHSAQDERRNWFGTLRPIHGEVGGLMVCESM